MSILGLDSNHTPFKYLDEYVSMPDWNVLHNDVCLGIARAEWSKRFVSSGVHTNWAEQEITTTILDIENRLTPIQLATFETLSTTDERIKYLNALTYSPHPFWLIFLRNNKRTEFTGVFNKAVASECEWTLNATLFPSLVKFIETLPFESIGRVLMFMTESNNKTVPHFDVLNEEQRKQKPHDDFIWFTTKPETKTIYVMDSESLEKTYADPSKRFVWWNEMDYHGTDAVPHFSFSIRIDGKFKPEVRNAIISSATGPV
jgi:hypothetical protein